MKTLSLYFNLLNYFRSTEIRELRVRVNRYVNISMLAVTMLMRIY